MLSSLSSLMIAGILLLGLMSGVVCLCGGGAV